MELRIARISNIRREPRLPIDHEFEPLEQLDLDSLVLTNITAEADYASIQDASGAQHLVGLESHLGRNWGRVVAIGDDFIEVEELHSNGEEWSTDLRRISRDPAVSVDLEACSINH